MKKYLVVIASSALLLAGATRTTVDAQVGIGYARGLDVSPTFDGWERNPDGTYTFYFGYFNRNTEEALDIPVGPDNNFDLGGDRGQPTHFDPSRRWWVFQTVVPADWPTDRRLVWTLITRGKTNQAKGWLQPEWEVDKDLIAKNAARDPSLMTNGTNELDMDHENRPPAITGSPAQTINLSEALTLTATATDDGRPKPVPDPTGRLQQGVRMRWIVYRGAGRVRFDPDIMSGRVYGKPATLVTKVRFDAAGAYRLRAIASDGQGFSTYDVDVTVK
jgi:hypothetical protein